MSEEDDKKPKDEDSKNNKSEKDTKKDFDEGKNDKKEEKKEKKMSPQRKRMIIIIAAIVLLIAAVIGFFWWLHARNYESTDDAFIDVHVVHIASQVPGRIQIVPVNDNQPVNAGDLLVQIDPSDYQARLNEALAARASAQAALLQAEAQRSTAAANVEQARAETLVAEANATNANVQLRRNRPLAASKVIASQQLDNYAANAKSSTANLEAVRKKEAAAQAQIGVVESQIEAAKAQIKSAEAQIEQAKLNLSYTRVGAPEAGHVAQKNVQNGDYISPGQNLMTLVPTNVWVTANFKETQIEHMHPGQPVDIEIDAYPNKNFHGHVDSIQSGGGAAFTLLPPENATGNYIKIVQRVPVKIVFDNPVDPNFPLGPGMSVVPTVSVRP